MSVHQKLRCTLHIEENTDAQNKSDKNEIRITLLFENFQIYSFA